MSGYDVSLADQGCPSCGHTADQECPCACCPAFEPGIRDISEDEYLADPVPGGSLSASGAKALLECPARYRYQREHPVRKQVFDFGSAAHKLALGAGPEITIVDYDDWRTKAAKEEREAARAAGVERGGKPEQSLFMQDEASGVWLRARLDWMPDPHSAMRPVIFDYKTTRSANPDSFAKSMYDYGYHVQAAFYADLYCQLTGVDAPFLFIAQEKEPPYLVTVCQPDADAMRAGRDKVRQAIEIYRDCTEAGIWPGYTDEIATISLPPWARAREDSE